MSKCSLMPLLFKLILCLHKHVCISSNEPILTVSVTLHGQQDPYSMHREWEEQGNNGDPQIIFALEPPSRLFPGRWGCSEIVTSAIITHMLVQYQMYLAQHAAHAIIDIQPTDAMDMKQAPCLKVIIQIQNHLRCNTCQKISPVMVAQAFFVFNKPKTNFSNFF